MTSAPAESQTPYTVDRSVDQSFLNFQLNTPNTFVQLDLSKPLGEGVYGQLFAGGWFANYPKEKGVPAALKRVNHPGYDKEDEFYSRVSNLEHEFQMLRLVAPYQPQVVVEAYAFFLDRTYGYLENAYLALELLQPNWKNGKEINWDNTSYDDILLMIYQVSLALEATQKAQVVHRDIKPSNVMIHESGHTKLIDFGTAIRQADIRRTSIAIGTLGYMGPETIVDDDRHFGPTSYQTDWYALSVMFYELLTSELPFSQGANDIQECMKRIVFDRSETGGPFSHRLDLLASALRDKSGSAVDEKQVLSAIETGLQAQIGNRFQNPLGLVAKLASASGTSLQALSRRFQQVATK